MSRISHSFGVAGLVLGVVLMSGCEDNPIDPAMPTLGVAPSEVRLNALADSVRLNLTAREGGQPVQVENAVWESANPAIARANQDGWVTAVGNGTVSISVSAMGQSASFTVHVAQTPCAGTGITTDPPLSEINDVWLIDAHDCNGYRIAAPAATFHSSSPNIVTVDADGLARVVGSGTVVLTVTAGGVSVSVEVMIAPASIGLRVRPDSPIRLSALGDAVALDAVAIDAEGRPLDDLTLGFSTSNPLSVLVDGVGRITAVGSGTASVSVWVNEFPDVRKILEVIVEQVPCEIVHSPVIPSDLPIGYRWQMIVLDCNGNHIEPHRVHFGSSDPAVIAVDANGIATVVGAGSVTLSVSAVGRTFTESFVVGQVP